MAVRETTMGADTVTFRGTSSKSSSLLLNNVDQPLSPSLPVRKTQTLSHCNCQLDSYDGQFLLCRYAKLWLEYIEHKTDLPVSYLQSVTLYERV
jgi:hypothetical protein